MSVIVVNADCNPRIFSWTMSANCPRTEFVSLLTEHQQSLRCFIISMLPGCEDVKDVLQETNVVLWEKMNSFEPGSNFRAWAFTVARHKVLQYRDREKRARRVALSDTLLKSIEEHRSEVRPEMLEAKLSALNQCLAALKPADRHLILARYADERPSRRESADRLGGSLRVTLCRIRRKLRDCVEKRMHLRDLEA